METEKVKQINVILEKGKDGYGVSFKEIDNVFGFGETVEDAKKDAKIALDNYINYLNSKKRPIPEMLQGDWELNFSFDIEAFLSYYSKIFTSTALEKLTGINASLMRQYAAGLKKPRKEQVKKIEYGLKKLGKELENLKLA